MADVEPGTVVQVGKGDRAARLKVDRRIPGLQGVLAVARNTRVDVHEARSHNDDSARLVVRATRVRQAPITSIVR